MKQIKKFIAIILILSLNFGIHSAFADQKSDQLVNNTINNTTQVDRGYTISYFGALIDEIPSTYKYIQLNIKNVEKGSNLEDALKKFVYLDRFPNLSADFSFNATIDAYEYYNLAKNLLSLNNLIIKADELKGREVNSEDLVYIRNVYYSIGESEKKPENETIIDLNGSTILGDKAPIFEDVLNTILNEHYNHSNMSKDDLIYAAMEGIAAGTGDPHTVYFPPLESQSFEDNLSGEYEGIGAYVHMASPGVVEVTSPVPGSPAELAGIKGGDIITAVDGKEITKDHTLNLVTSWIKGIEGTAVTITVLRDGKEFDLEVTRQKIVIKNIETKEYIGNTYYVKINTFNANVSAEFTEVLETIKTKKVDKIIFDLRNNGGGYLHEVVAMLSNLVEKGEKVAMISYLGFNENAYSDGPVILNLNDYEVIILQNSGTASASEIFIGTLLDYYDNIVTIGENTYGKGSVQSMITYIDGSTLKFTSAKWFTGGTETGIDGVGISPKVELELDVEAFQDGEDNQLDKALNY